MKFDLIILKLMIKIHNYLYVKIGSKSIKLNGGIHPKHRLMNYHQFFLDNIKEKSDVLDIGCSSGELSHDIAKKANKVVAIDINGSKIKKAKEKYNRYNIKYIVADATKMECNEIFDYVVLSNVLEHIEDRYNFLLAIKPLARDFLIRVPMINRSWITLYKRELGCEYRLDDTHYTEYTFDTFRKEIEAVGLKIITYSIQFGEIWAKVG